MICCKQASFLVTNTPGHELHNPHVSEGAGGVLVWMKTSEKPPRLSGSGAASEFPLLSYSGFMKAIGKIALPVARSVCRRETEGSQSRSRSC